MRNGGSYGNSSNEKDQLIATMKKQLYQLRQLDHENAKLLDEVKATESKHSLLEDENQRIQSQYKVKSEMNRQTITMLRNQIDNFKIQIHKCSVQINDAIRESANLKRVCDNRESQIEALMSTHQDIEQANKDQSQVNYTLSNKIKSMKDERNRSEVECERLRKILEDNIANLKGLEKEARFRQSENRKNENMILIAEADYSELTNDLKSRDEKVMTTEKKLEGLQKQREELKEKTIKLQKQCNKADADLKATMTDLENAIAKNKDLALQVKNQEKILRNEQNQCDRALLQRQALMKQHSNLATSHEILNKQIDRCLLSIMEYEKINQDLQKDIRHFMECDEQARTLLNRREKMSSFLEQILMKLQKTGHEIDHLRR